MDILDSGINLMLYGMGTVFVFLGILIATTILMSRLINRFPDQATANIARSISPKPQAQNQQIDPQLLSILQAAIRAHKQPD